jgi:hypothetical protein
MATITVTNLTPDSVYIGDLYTNIPASGSVVLSRPAATLSSMSALMKAVAASQVTVAVVYDAHETASGLLVPPEAVDATDMAAVAATSAAAGAQTIRKAFTAGAGGSPDDVVVYAVNTLPYKMRIMDAYALVSTAVAASTLDVRSAAAGAGTVAASMSAAAAGRAASTVTASVVLSPGAAVGLFVRRSDSGIAGEVVLSVRRES